MVVTKIWRSRTDDQVLEVVAEPVAEIAVVATRRPGTA